MVSEPPASSTWVPPPVWVMTISDVSSSATSAEMVAVPAISTPSTTSRARFGSENPGAVDSVLTSSAPVCVAGSSKSSSKARTSIVWGMSQFAEVNLSPVSRRQPVTLPVHSYTCSSPILGSTTASTLDEHRRVDRRPAKDDADRVGGAGALVDVQR